MPRQIPKIISKAFLFLFFPSLLTVSNAQTVDFNWIPREDLNILLPSSVRIFETNGFFADGAPLRAMYATVDLRDKNLRLRAIGSNSLRETTQATAQRHNALLAINGGYFSAVKSESVLISDGEIIATGPRNFTRGAFALVNRKPQVAWPYVDSLSNIFNLESPVDITKHNSTELGKKLKPWHPSQVVGAGPVLIKSGRLRDTSSEEGFGASHLIRHPRTAIGYKDENTLVMLVVDGRQQSSAGATITELGMLMLQLGCYEAVNLDGGGSSAMIAADEIVNVPVDQPNGNRNSLRKNASALVLTEEIPSQEKEVIIIDTDDNTFFESGIWKNSNHANHYGTTPSREARANFSNTARYKFDNISTGTFQVSAWWTVNEKNTANARYVLHHSNQIDTLTFDQTSYALNGKWSVLGNFYLESGDFLEILSDSKKQNLVVDAIRLVRIDALTFNPRRGDLRIAVISDLNSGLGSSSYEWQVDSIMQRLPRIWKPDLVLCGGDMVAGMGVSDTTTISKMWKGFKEHIFKPLASSRIPFAFTIGNHDGLRSYPLERKAIENYWHKPENSTGLSFVDRTHFPSYYSFKSGNSFFVSWDASSSEITHDNLKWLQKQFDTAEAKSAKQRFVIGHLPIYSVAQERDSKGNVLANGDSLRLLLERYGVKAYISGHQHAYYPGKHGKLQLINLGAAGSGPRRWLTTDKDPVNTVTIMDIYYDRDTIVYTTYDIKHKNADDMTVFDYHELPSSITGVNGYLIRNDLERALEISGHFQSIASNATSLQTKGTVNVKLAGKKMLIEGNFLLGNKILKDGILLRRGKHSESGEVLFKIQAKSKNGKQGTFNASFPLSDEIIELLSAGEYHILIRSEKFPEGEIRAQLYPNGNHVPQKPVILSHQERNIYGVRNVSGLYKISWTPSSDIDGDPVSYTYQLSSDSLFSKVLLHESTDRVTFIKRTESSMYALMNNLPIGTTASFYHRVVATDGRNISVGRAALLQLKRSDEPLNDFIELDPEHFTFAGKIDNAEGQGSGALWDKSGMLWLADYGGVLYAKMPSGEDAFFSPVKNVTVDHKMFNLKPINGIGLDLDGNILVASNRTLLKINSKTGQGIAAWEAPAGKRAIISPRVNEKGEVYAMSLFAEDPNYVLRQSASNPTTFETVRTISLPQRILSRTFDMRADGLTLFFPDPGSALIQTFNSSDGTTYKRGPDITSIAAGCNAISNSGDTLFATVRPSGVTGATLHVRDEKQKVMWTLPLNELDGAEARGMAVSQDQQTIIICAWDKGGGFYRYRKVK